MGDNGQANLTQEQKTQFFQSIHDQYIQPELAKRFGSSGFSEGFQIREFRIMIPISQPPIVEFNNEIGWLIENPILSDGRNVEDFDLYQSIHLYDVISIGTVLAPRVGDNHVPFLYGHNNGFGWVIFVGSPDDSSKNEYIAHHLQQVLIERVVRWTNGETIQRPHIRVLANPVPICEFYLVH